MKSMAIQVGAKEETKERRREMVGVRFEPELSLKLGSGEGSVPRDDELRKKQMTMFFNGEMRVFDVTEAQARAIICSAMQQIENEKKQLIHENDTNNKMSQHKHEQSTDNSAKAVSPPIQPSELSMKRSLQRFLQKRKARMAATSPYSPKQMLSLSLS
ncbi:Jasmonate ZIM-domain protein 12b [Rhynchospora pubera]|uniref:Protein TIFY n=1 Tax=Rhynchospora pubera TaxID=906938 RepID=A0AAV8ETD1_9POAL|nr:Jasmonate ZIM-domain protein 12b [Rhynchospora pubera]